MGSLQMVLRDMRGKPGHSWSLMMKGMCARCGGKTTSPLKLMTVRYRSFRALCAEVRSANHCGPAGVGAVAFFKAVVRPRHAFVHRLSIQVGSTAFADKISNTLVLKCGGQASALQCTD